MTGACRVHMMPCMSRWLKKLHMYAGLLNFSILLVFGWIGVLALHVVAILKGISGRRLIIPGLSHYADRF